MRWTTLGLAVALALIVWPPGAEASERHRGDTGLVVAACRRTGEHPGSEPPIVRRVCHDLPGLAGHEVSDRRAADVIRDWAFRNADERGEQDFLLADGRRTLALPDDAWRMSASELLEVFDRDRLGARCGETAWFLMRVYDAFGLEAYIYNFGFPDATAPPVEAASHVVTLVRVDGDLVPEDAHFNQTIRARDGASLDVGTVLARLRDRHSDSIRFVRPRPFPDRQVLLPEASYEQLRPMIGKPGTVALGLHDCRHRDGYRRCRDSRYVYASVDQRVPSFGAPALDLIVAGGWPRNIDYLMMFPLGLSSDADGWTPYERIAESTPTAATLRDIDRAIHRSG